jgi:hypothetical protein
VKTAPDSNVRPPRRAAAGTARAPGGSALARLLLCLLKNLLPQLDRKLLLLLLAASTTSACIIPVGPEFQDPGGVPNVAPQIVDSNPAQGQQIPAIGTAKFTITVEDLNEGDPLYYFWVAEFPDYVPFVTHKLSAGTPMQQPSANGGARRQPVEETFDCSDFDTRLTTHKIEVVVGDRALAENDLSNPRKIADGGQTAIATWTLTLTCPTQQQ